MTDRDPRRTHAFDQLDGLLGDLSGSLYRYYSKLIAQGFCPDEAMRLTLGAQESVLRRTESTEDEPPQ